MKIVSNELTSPRQASDRNPSYTLSGTCCLRQSTIFIPHLPPLVKHKLQEKRTAAVLLPLCSQGGGARADKHATSRFQSTKGMLHLHGKGVFAGLARRLIFEEKRKAACCEQSSKRPYADSPPLSRLLQMPNGLCRIPHALSHAYRPLPPARQQEKGLPCGSPLSCYGMR